MTASKLLILMYCTHIEIFLKEAEIISIKINVIFNEHDEVFHYDSEDVPNELGINKD